MIQNASHMSLKVTDQLNFGTKHFGCIIFINLYKYNDSGNIDVDMYAQVQVYRYYKRVSI